MIVGPYFFIDASDPNDIAAKYIRDHYFDGYRGVMIAFGISVVISACTSVFLIRKCVTRTGSSENIKRNNQAK